MNLSSFLPIYFLSLFFRLFFLVSVVLSSDSFFLSSVHSALLWRPFVECFILVILFSVLEPPFISLHLVFLSWSLLLLHLSQACLELLRGIFVWWLPCQIILTFLSSLCCLFIIFCICFSIFLGWTTKSDFQLTPEYFGYIYNDLLFLLESSVLTCFL